MINVRALGSEEGSAAAEFAILGPLLMLLLGGVIQVGSIVQASMVASNAAREGARYAAVSNGADGSTEAVAYLSNALGGRNDVILPAANQVSITSQGVGNAVTVSLPVTVKLTMPVIQKIMGGSVVLNGSATMRVLQ